MQRHQNVRMAYGRFEIIHAQLFQAFHIELYGETIDVHHEKHDAIALRILDLTAERVIQSLGGIDAISVDVIQYHLESFRYSVFQFYL